MTTNKQQLRELAEGVIHWSGSFKDVWPSDLVLNDVWEAGNIDEDGNQYPVIEVDADQYDAPGDSEKIARFFSAANPEAVLALLDEVEALQAECELLRNATGWVSVDDALPELDVPVWVQTYHSVFIGGRVDDPDGWRWGRCYCEPWINDDGAWAADIECYDNHMVTAWHPLPELPVIVMEDRV